MYWLYGWICVLGFSVCFTDCRYVVHKSDKQIDTGLVLRDRRQAGENDEEQCGTLEVEGTKGSIVLHTREINGSAFYARQKDCSWSFQAEEGHHVILTSQYFDIELSEDCSWDYLQISEQGDIPVTYRFCGYDPVNYVSLSNQVDLHFHSDESFEDRGFYFDIDTIQDSTTESLCNSTVIGGNGGSISSAAFSTTYPLYQVCFYRIQAPPGKLVQFDLRTVDFGDRPCEVEGVNVYTGVSTEGEPIGSICLDTNMGVLPFKTDKAFVHYFATKTSPGGTGFELGYSFVEDDRTTTVPPPTALTYFGGTEDCSSDIEPSDITIIIKSPAFQRNKDCVTIVRNNYFHNHVVQVTFTTFDMEESEDCIFDYLKVISGERNASPSLGKFCGEKLRGRTFVTSGNALRLEYKTDESFSLVGYEAEVSFVPVSECHCDGNSVCMRKRHEKICIDGHPCDSDRCQNDGKCVEHRGREECHCRHGFYGDNCGEELPGAVRPLKFKIRPQSSNITKNGAHTVECSVHQDQGVIYSWLRENELIPPYEPDLGFGYLEGGVLRIDSFTEEMEGTYICEARTPATTAEYSFDLAIQSRCFIKISFPRRNIQVSQNKIEIIRCSAESAVEIQWKKDGRLIDTTENSKYRMLSGNKFLEIKNVQMADAGTYQCEVRSESGCVVTREAKLTVIEVRSTSEYCGKSYLEEATKRVTRGDEVEQGESPWHVMLTTNLGPESKSFCGGSLISTRWVLTAAHCIDYITKDKGLPFNEANVKLIIGSTRCGKVVEEGSVQRAPITVLKHMDYGRGSKMNNDIALLQLDSPVEFNNLIRPICLNTPNFVNEALIPKSKLTSVNGKVVGCGRKKNRGSASKHLQSIRSPYVDWGRCKEAMDQLEMGEKVTENMICYGSSKVDMGDSCSGDSGGSVVMGFEGQWYQTGIVSWGSGCDQANSYGIYTNVSSYYDWISHVTEFDEEIVEI